MTPAYVGRRPSRPRPGLSTWLPSLAFLVLLAPLALGWQSGQSPIRVSEPASLSAYPWPYLRDGQLPGPGEALVELDVVGDVMLGRGVAVQSDPLGDAAPWLRASDLTLGNLEGVISARDLDLAPALQSPSLSGVGFSAPPHPPAPYPQSGAGESAIPPLRRVDRGQGLYSLSMPPSAAAALRDAGFDLLSLANNHTLDGGPSGLAETIAYLSEAGITPLGLGIARDAAPQPIIRQVRGVRLAFLAFNMVPYPKVPGNSGDVGSLPVGWDPETAAAAIAGARAVADAVIVSVHWGYEYELRVDPAQRAAAQVMLAAGADLVVGHHPHVVQALGQEGEGFVAYSLGNFVFDQQFDETRQGLALRAFFDVKGLRAVQALPLDAGPHPRLMRPAEAAPLLARLDLAATPAENRAAFVCTDSYAGPGREKEAGQCRPVETMGPVTAGGGIFTDGTIDLTGDGRPEEVQLRDGTVTVYAATAAPAPGGRTEVWRSPPEWRVVDVALGDANDDGRGELLLAMWKPDAGGIPRSHPFIIGYRQGIYRTLWGGSALVRPLREVEMADVDGDGAGELIVLDEDGPDASRVSLWDWNGWGFSLRWRSEPGRYRELALLSAPGERVPLIGVTYEAERSAAD